MDSHLLLWLRLEKHRLPSSIIALLEDSSERVFYSVVTPWELSIKYMKGKINLPPHFFDSLSKLGFPCMAVEERHLGALRQLPPLHHDPFDRMLIAQAMTENMTLITADKHLTDYPLKTLLVNT